MDAEIVLLPDSRRVEAAAVLAKAFAPDDHFRKFFPTIDDYTVVDMQYTYMMPSFGFQADGSAVTVGVKNLTDEDPPSVNTDGGFDPFASADPRGRIYYFRYRLNI